MDIENVDFEIELPEVESVRNLTIHEEFFWLIQNGQKRKIRLHNYSEIYKINFLYEYVMNQLDYQSHIVLSSLLVKQFTQAGGKIEDMVVLDMGAGTGLVGQTLANLGVKSIVGIDRIPEAAEAAQRQYPGIYENYYVGEFNLLHQGSRNTFTNRDFNCLMCCSAIAPGHIGEEFSFIFNQITPQGWVAFNVAQYFWEDESEAGFHQQNSWVNHPNIFKIVETQTYRHRGYMDNRSLDYLAIVGRKISSF